MAVPPEGDGVDNDDPRRRPRIGGNRRWRVFYRGVSTGLMRRVGSVNAPFGDLATEQAWTLFGSGDANLWPTPADEFLRLGGSDLVVKDEELADGTKHDRMEYGGAGDARGTESGVSVE